MRISVLVVSHNVRELLARCLASIPAGFEIIVVDNASNDGSTDMVRERFPAVRLIAWSDNRGFSCAVNAAAKAASGDVYLILNPDAALPDAAALALVRLFEERPELGAVGFRQVASSGVYQLSVGPPPWLWAELLRRLIQRQLDRDNRWLGTSIDKLLSTPRKVPWVAGSALLVRRQAFWDIGGFDEEFFLFFEDIDFCLRLRGAGWPVAYDPRLTVVHERGRSASQNKPASQRAYRDSQLRFWQKHRGPLIRRLVEVYLRLVGQAPG